MSDMSQVIIPKSDQINAESLIAGPITIKITSVDIRAGTEQPVTVNYEGGEGKPWKPCKSMSKVLVYVWGADSKAYVGKSLTLYRDPNVKWGGLAVGGIRISHMSGLEKDTVFVLAETKGKMKPITVKPLAVAPQFDAIAFVETVERAIADAQDGDALTKWWADQIANRKALAGLLPDEAARLKDAVAAKIETFKKDF